MFKELPKPACYMHLDTEEEWIPCCKQMIEDLERLASQDGCIAAAWALKMIEELNDTKRNH